MIDSNTYIHKKGSELKVTGKLREKSKKIILIEYRNSTTYWLYDWKNDRVIVFSSIDFNESKLEFQELKESSTTSSDDHYIDCYITNLKDSDDDCSDDND